MAHKLGHSRFLFKVFYSHLLFFFCFRCDKQNKMSRLEEIKKIAQGSGCTVLSNVYQGLDVKHLFQCRCGNTFNRSIRLVRQMKPGAILQCRPCRYKDQINKQIKPIDSDDLNSIVAGFGGQVLDWPTPILINSYVKVRCDLHENIFTSRVWNLKAGHWGCLKCADRYLLDLHEIKELISKRGGSLISNSVTSAKEYFDILCGDGHLFKINLNKINQGRWCPRCSDSRLIGEEITRQFVEYLFQKRFVKCKPEWLTFQDKRLELDGYCEEIGIAFEHDGDQHFRHIKRFHNYFTLDQLQSMDRAKDSLCKQKGIILLRFKEHKNGQLLCQQLRAQSSLLEGKTFKDPELFVVDVKKAYSGRNVKLKESLSAVLLSVGWKLIDVEYGSYAMAIVQCDRGHTIRRNSASIRLKKIFFCKECHVQNRGY